MWPLGQHSRLQFALCEAVNRFGEPRRLAFAFPELRVIFGGAAYVPDIAICAWKRIPRTANCEVGDAFDAAPDVAIEIVSPEQSANALVRRCVWYVENGSGTALLVDPGDRSVVRFEPDKTARVLRAADAIDFGSVLPGLTLTVAEMFGALRLPCATRPGARLQFTGVVGLELACGDTGAVETIHVISRGEHTWRRTEANGRTRCHPAPAAPAQ